MSPRNKSNAGPADLAARMNFSTKAQGPGRKPRTADKKRHPVKVTFTKKLSERTLLFNVYRYTLLNWAVSEADIADGTKLDAKEVKRLTRKLATKGLLAGTHVNSEKSLTWQTFYDVENDRGAIKAGEKSFAEAYPVDEPVKEPVKKATHAGATGSRYMPEQLEAGRKARESGAGWKQVAEAAGVKSPHHFSNVLRATYPEVI